MSGAVRITRLDLSAAELRKLAKKQTKPLIVRRMLAIALVLDGVDRQTAARSCGMDRQTLRDWVHHYNAEGIAGLRERRTSGHKSPPEGGCAMRHDPASAAVVIMLRALKMYGMAQAVNDLMEQASPAFAASVPILSQLLKAETAEREVRSIDYQIKAARFPAYKDLAGFDFASSEINEALVRQLHAGPFIDDAHNVVLIGGPGTGKTHIAMALAV
jgi:IstB-like ATP binding protein/Winged helix-turn helix